MPLWNRLIKTDEARLTKNIFNYDYDVSGKTWTSEIKSIFQTIGFLDHYTNKRIVDIKQAEESLKKKNSQDWSHKVQSVSKLRETILFSKMMIVWKSI